MTEKRAFSLRAILTVTTKKWFLDGWGPLFEILNFMTRDNLFKHQLPRARDECTPWLLRQHPPLAEIDTEEISTANAEEWIERQLERLGETLEIEPIPQDDHERIDAYDELVCMRGTDEGIIIVDPTTGQVST